jgi:hypothetical protein
VEEDVERMGKKNRILKRNSAKYPQGKGMDEDQ